MKSIPGEENATLSLDLQVTAAPHSVRHGEPVTCGVPWPKGALRDRNWLILRDSVGQAVPLQTSVLDLWQDGSVRWLLLDWRADVDGAAQYRLTVDAGANHTATESAGLQVVWRDEQLVIDTGVAQHRLALGTNVPLLSTLAGPGSAPITTRLLGQSAESVPLSAWVKSVEVIEHGALRTTVVQRGHLRLSHGEILADLEIRWHFFANLHAVRGELCVRNSRRALHPGGLWDLGDAGSILITDLSLVATLPASEAAGGIHFSLETSSDWRSCKAGFSLEQESSGGENWRSSNHLSRNRVVPLRFRGYRFRADDQSGEGLRATPVVVLERGAAQVAIGVRQFWQNFPRALEASHDELTLRLWPCSSLEPHELQGGEQKTHHFWLSFGHDPISERTLDWCREPLEARAADGWYGRSETVFALTSRAFDRHHDYNMLVEAAIEGRDTFFQKREIIDEFGWRHFGDVYGDHEAVFHQGSAPLVSHYNNQYDALFGFWCHYLRGGDWRWRDLAQDLAWHVIDIDLYHTDQDKSAYNHGLFWHTFHYVDADTGTHRSYPRAAQVCGGGPSAEHAYAGGLAMHYFLTGDLAAREAVIAMAQWIVDLDDGRRTIFRFLARGATGLASSSGTPDYHGPGRGPANAILVLLEGHRLTRRDDLLSKAEELIRRCIHPRDEIASRNLLDAERRWYYTMFLQSLGRFLDYKAELGQLDDTYAYARESLLHYARWMAANEYPYLDRPEILEYPTETWAAQDMRKCEVFHHAARHALAAERARFLERAQFFFDHSTRTLRSLPTATLARPVILLLTNGPFHDWCLAHHDRIAPAPPVSANAWGTPRRFIPQKSIVKRRLPFLVGGVGILGLVGLAVLIQQLVTR